EPALPPEPREARTPVDGADARHHDRREEHEEAPEDERVHRAGHEPLEQLALPEHDRRLVAHPRGDVAAAVDGLAGAHEAHEEQRAPGEERPGGCEERREGDGAGGDRYEPCAFLSSAVIAGTISCRSPTTA